MKKCSGIILKTSYEKMGSTAEIELLGKTMLDWVSLSLLGNSVVAIDNKEDVPVPALIREHLDPDSEYTVVLYSDTPLITRKTVNDAIELAKQNDANVIRMTRGYVFKTEFVKSVEKIYSDNTYYFEEEDFVTAYSFKQVSFVTDILKNRILTYHMNHGVHFEDPASTHVGCDVSIGNGVTIGPNNIIKGSTVIKNNVKVSCGNVIEDCIIDDGAVVESSKIVHSYVGKGTKVGPFANLRADNVIGANCNIGDFVELKNCKIGDDCKIGHLCYAGDIVMGKNCNVGAGVVFANYDGKDKHSSIIGNDVFIGSSSTVVAPVRLGDKSFIAAGSVVTENVEKGALAIARSRQVVKPDYQNNKYVKD